MTATRTLSLLACVAGAGLLAACQTPTAGDSASPTAGDSASTAAVDNQPATTAPAPAAQPAVTSRIPPAVDRITVPPAAEIDAANLATAPVAACNEAAYDRAIAQIGGASRVATDFSTFGAFSDPRNGLPGLLGEIKYLTDNADWQRFAFRCLYDPASGQVARFEIETV